jgi:hypothetical protein
MWEFTTQGSKNETIELAALDRVRLSTPRQQTRSVEKESYRTTPDTLGDKHKHLGAWPANDIGDVPSVSQQGQQEVRTLVHARGRQHDFLVNRVVEHLLHPSGRKTVKSLSRKRCSEKKKKKQKT